MISPSIVMMSHNLGDSHVVVDDLKPNISLFHELIF